MSFCARPIGGGEEGGDRADDGHRPTSATGASSNSGDSRPPCTRRPSPWWRRGSAPTPASGPSMASGSQVCSRNCADLPMAPMNSSRQASVSACQSWPRKRKVLSASSATRGKIVVERDRAEQHEHQEDAEREAEVADAVDDEGLDRRGVGGGLLVPEADQQVARQPHALPAEEQLHEVVGRHQHQHGEGEQRQVGEEPRPVRILVPCSRSSRGGRAPTRSSPRPASPRSACRCGTPSRPRARPT